MNVTQSVVSVLAISLACASTGVAQLQSKAQQECLNALNKSGAKVAEAQGRENADCVKKGGKGKLPVGQTASDCLTADGRGRVGRATAATVAAAAKSCGTSPDFGFTGASVVNDAAVNEKIGLVEDVFGADLAAAIITVAADKAGAACQVRVAKDYEKIFSSKVKEFLTCKKKGLNNGSIASTTGLEACFNAIMADAKGKIARAIARLARDVSRRCSGVDTDVVFPGLCVGAPDLTDCVDALVGCRVCSMLNAMDGLAADCDLFSDGSKGPRCNRPLPVVPRFGLEATGGRVAMVPQLGAELHRIYGGGWNRYEPNPPVNGVHTYDWTSLDQNITESADAGNVVFLEIHPTSGWASSQECLAIKLAAEKGADCPVLPAYYGDFRVFVVELVSRYQDRIRFIQLGAEYDRSAWWSGTNEEYLGNLEVFVGAVRSASSNVAVVSNGIANIHSNRISSDANGDFLLAGAVRVILMNHRELALQYGIDPDTATDAELLAVYDQYKDVPFGQGTLASAVASEQRSHEMLHLLASRHDLFDVFDARSYVFYKYDPTRLGLDMAFLRGLMQRYGWNAPLLPTETSGAMLNNQGRQPNAAALFAAINDENDPQHDATLAWHRAEQGFEVVRIYTTLFAEGVSGLVWYRGLDSYTSPYYLNSPYWICGLTYLESGQVLPKPSAFVFSYFASQTAGFETVERMDSDADVDLFAYRWSSGQVLYVGWYNPTPSPDAIVQTDSVSVQLSVTPGSYLATSMDPDQQGVFPSQVIDAASGSLVIQLTEIPVFLESGGP